MRSSLVPLFVLLALVADATLGKTPRVHAAAGEAAPDLDGDFLPDCVEWAVLTNASQPDSDFDQVSDFVEVVQRGAPRRSGMPMPADQEMRLVVAAPSTGTGQATTDLHLLMRILGDVSAISSFQTWVELPGAPGVRFSFDMLALGQATLDERASGAEGLWLRLTVPLASMAALEQLAPLSIHVESTVGGRLLRSAVKLIEAGGQLASLVPFDERGFALQSLQPQLDSTLSNRVCVLELRSVGTSLFEITAADCEDCNEVECSAACGDCVGWVIDVPGGLQVLSGN
jgi:hypothetical protein